MAPISTAPTPAATPAAPSDSPAPLGQVFDVVPALHAILNRLLLPPSTAGGGPTNAGNDDLHLGTHLDIAHLDTAVDAVRVRIAKARAAVKALPDMDRTVEEQEEEI